MFKKNDILLVGSIILLAIILLFMLNLMKTEGAKVVIMVDGKEYKALDLSENRTIEIENSNGDKNIVAINDGKVKMIEANCPDKLCVKHRSIQYDHESIICLPHKIVVEIKKGKENEVDIQAK